MVDGQMIDGLQTENGFWGFWGFLGPSFIVNLQ